MADPRAVLQTLVRIVGVWEILRIEAFLEHDTQEGPSETRLDASMAWKEAERPGLEVSAQPRPVPPTVKGAEDHCGGRPMTTDPRKTSSRSTSWAGFYLRQRQAAVFCPKDPSARGVLMA